MDTVNTDFADTEVVTRRCLRWTFDSLGDPFLVYNYNVRDRMDRWSLDATQLMVKAQYAIRW